MSVKNYRNYTFSSGSTTGEDYLKFQSVCRNELKKMCAENGFNLHSFSKNHYEWSAVLEKDGKFVFVSLSDVRFWDWYNDVLVRSMKHDRDWTGGTNHKVSWNEVMTTATNIVERGW